MLNFQDANGVNATEPSYLLSDLSQANELFKLGISVRLKDFDILSELEVEQLDSIDKEEWEKFLRLYFPHQ